MKWIEGKYEHRWRHSDGWWCWQDLLHVMLVTAIIAIGIALLLLAILALSAPRVATAGDVVNFRRERRLAAVVIPVEKVTTRASKPIRIMFMEVSAYSPTVQETDGNPHRTASGKHVYVGGIAADLRVLPFGSRVIIPGYNNGLPCTVVDTGGMIKGNRLDIFVWSAHEAIHWGRRRNVPVQILYIPKE